MATIVKKDNPSSRLDAGNHVIEAAKTTDTRSIKKRLALFAAAHKALLAAEGAVTKAEEALATQRAKVGEADVAQDEAVERLANALVAAGASRVHPFKALGFAAPSVVKELGYAREAKEAQRLAKAASKGKPAKETATACKELVAAAHAVEAALAPVAKLEGALRAARTQRDALAQPWETAYAALKNAARAAEDDGARGIFGALFHVASPRPKRKAAKSANNASPPAAPSLTA
jgi:hypothetical protein